MTNNTRSLHRTTSSSSFWERIGICTSTSVAILGTVLLFTSVLNAYSSWGGLGIGLGGREDDGGDYCAISFGPYRGPRYVSPGVTVGRPSCIFRSKWLMVSRHAVRVSSPDGESDAAVDEKNLLIDDWVWVDYHDRVNVLVQTNDGRRRGMAGAGAGGGGAATTRKLVVGGDPGEDDDDGRRYLVFRQTKYGLEGRDSLAVIGGIIEPDDEDAENAARREVEEETGLKCRTFVKLGRFRTDVNRGMGWVNSFVARDCGAPEEGANQDGGEEAEGAAADAAARKEEEVGAADGERQDVLSLSHSELREAAMDGRFLEVQWSNTVALALIHPDL